MPSIPFYAWRALYTQTCHYRQRVAFYTARPSPRHARSPAKHTRHSLTASHPFCARCCAGRACNVLVDGMPGMEVDDKVTKYCIITQAVHVATHTHTHTRARARLLMHCIVWPRPRKCSTRMPLGGKVASWHTAPAVPLCQLSVNHFAVVSRR